MTALTLIATDDGDPFGRTLDELAAASQQLHLAALAHRAPAPGPDPDAQREALNDLHHQLRGMAARLNYALGGWPAPSEEEPQ